MDKDYLTLLHFLQEKSLKTISITYLNQLQDIVSENGIITPEKFSIVRKRILDTMNDGIRNNNELFDKIKDLNIINK